MPDEPVRKGKIGRLPVAIRNEVNRRLFENESGAKIITWLNAQPDVLRVLDEYFGEEPITPQNLSEWRKGGYQDWLRRREEVERIKDLAEFSLKLGEAAGGSVSDGSAAILGGRIMAEIEAAAGYTPEQIEAVAMLRKGDHDRVKLQQSAQSIELKRKEVALDEKRFQRTTCELFIKWADDKKVKEVIESRATNAEKIEKLGQAIFGEDWE